FRWYPSKSQDVESYYAEARAPLISDGNARTFMRELELQVSARHDRYTTNGMAANSFLLLSREGPFPDISDSYDTNRLQSTDYTFGVRFRPFESLALRVSFGTGFLPPGLTQVSRTETSGWTSNLGQDPKRGGTPAYVG